jgi:hypothetical protein
LLSTSPPGAATTCAAAEAIAAGQGEGLADIVVRNNRPVAAELMPFLGWTADAA